MTAPQSCGAAGRGSRTPSPCDPQRAGCGPRGTGGSRVLPRPLLSLSLPLALAPQEISILLPLPPKSKTMSIDWSRVPRCPFRPAARGLVQGIRHHPPAPAPCGDPFLSPESELPRELVLLRQHQSALFHGPSVFSEEPGWGEPPQPPTPASPFHFCREGGVQCVRLGG